MPTTIGSAAVSGWNCCRQELPPLDSNAATDRAARAGRDG
jgi:hypothetical protein